MRAQLHWESAWETNEWVSSNSQQHNVTAATLGKDGGLESQMRDPKAVLGAGEAFPGGDTIKRSLKGKLRGWHEERRMLQVRRTVMQRLKCESVEIWESANSYFQGVFQMVKNLPAMQKIGVESMGWEDPLEKGMVTQSSILAWKIPWTEEPGGLQSMGLQRVRHNWAINTFTFKHVTVSDGIYTEGVFWPGSFLCGTGMGRGEEDSLVRPKLSLVAWGRGRKSCPRDWASTSLSPWELGLRALSPTICHSPLAMTLMIW